jgi:hypothetical protein
LTSSSLCGLMMASIFFISSSVSQQGRQGPGTRPPIARGLESVSRLGML